MRKSGDTIINTEFDLLDPGTHHNDAFRPTREHTAILFAMVNNTDPLNMALLAVCLEGGARDVFEIENDADQFFRDTTSRELRLELIQPDQIRH